MEYLGDHLRPAVDEVSPSVFDLKPALLTLALGLLEKNKVAPVVQVPGDRALRERRGVRQGRPWRIFTQPCGIHNQRTGSQARERDIVTFGIVHQLVFDWNIESQRVV